MHIGQTLLLGDAPNAVEHPQNSFERVMSCEWTSSPITASYASLAIVVDP
jgi:hypothetical protein